MNGSVYKTWAGYTQMNGSVYKTRAGKTEMNGFIYKSWAGYTQMNGSVYKTWAGKTEMNGSIYKTWAGYTVPKRRAMYTRIEIVIPKWTALSLYTRLELVTVYVNERLCIQDSSWLYLNERMQEVRVIRNNMLTQYNANSSHLFRSKIY